MASAAPALDGPGVRRRDWQTISVIGIAHAASHFFQLVLPLLYVPLAREFGYDFAQLGLLVSMFYIISGLGQASSGFLVDRIGARPVLWFGLSCFVLAGVIIGAAPNYAFLMVGAILGGVGNSVFHPVDFSLMNSRISAARLGHAFSTHGLTGNLGWAFSPLFMTTLTLWAGWRVAAFGAAALVAAVLLLTILGRHLLADPPASRSDTATPQPGDAQHKAGEVQAAEANGPGEVAMAPSTAAAVASTEPTGPVRRAGSLASLLRTPALWAGFGFFACTSMGLAAVQNYTIPLLQQIYTLTPVAASGALSSYMLASAAGMLAGGFLVSSRMNTERIVLVALILAGVTLVWLALGGVPTALATPVFALAGFCAGVAGPSRDMLIRRVTPKGAMGSVYGLVYSGMDVGAALAPFAFGLMLDIGLTSGPWVGAGMAFVIGALLAQLIAYHARLKGQ